MLCRSYKICQLTMFAVLRTRVGLGKKASLVKELGVDTVDVMRKLKASLDPLWIMNPSKVFDFREF